MRKNDIVRLDLCPNLDVRVLLEVLVVTINSILLLQSLNLTSCNLSNREFFHLSGAFFADFGHFAFLFFDELPLLLPLSEILGVLLFFVSLLLHDLIGPLVFPFRFLFRLLLFAALLLFLFFIALAFLGCFWIDSPRRHLLQIIYICYIHNQRIYQLSHLIGQH